MGVESQQPAAAHRTQSFSMKCLLVISLLGAALANPLSLDNEDAVNDMLDMVDSSLETEPEGRALWVSVTLTATSTSLSTATETTTVTESCWTTTAALSNCTTRRRSMSDFESLITEGLTVERDGMKVDPLTIMPSKPTQARADFEKFDVDGVIVPQSELSSGQMTWKEVAVQGLQPGCGRSSGPQKRPRFIMLENETLIKNFTITMTVAGITCTTAGFTFSISACA